MVEPTIINDNSLDYIKTLPGGSFDLIIHDPPFNLSEEENFKWFIQYTRLIKNGGNVLSVNFNDNNLFLFNMIINSKILNYLQSVTIIQTIAIKRTNGRFADNQMTIMNYHKGSVYDRKRYYELEKGNYRIMDDMPEQKGIIPSIWNDRRHKPGYVRHNDNFDFVHSSAMAQWVAERIMLVYARPGDKVLDSFGGAGTIPFVCKHRNIECTSIELDKKNFDNINLRLKIEKFQNKDLSIYAEMLAQKAYNKAYDFSDTDPTLTNKKNWEQVVGLNQNG